MDGVEGKQELYQFMENMSCLSAMTLEYPDRCFLSHNLKHCDNYTNVINYFELMYCSFEVRTQLRELAVLCFFSLIYFLLLCNIYMCINQYYLPALKIAAIRLKMNEYLAGVILVGVGNATPDFLLNLSMVRAGAATMNISMCSSLAAICVSGGAICFIMPFKMNGSCVFRDFLFVVLLLELVRFFMVSKVPGNWVKAAIIFLIYPIYIVVNVFDLVLMRYNIRKLRREINILKYEPSSTMLDKILHDKVLTLTELEVDEDIQLIRMKTGHGIFHAGVYVTPKPLVETLKVDVEKNRTALHSKNNPKNLFLLAEFFEDLNPIDLEQWSLSGKLWRLQLILTAPVLLFLRLTIPRVNYELIKHGWSKLLNCLQIIISPFITCLVLETINHSSHDTSWMIHLHYNWACWSLVITVPLAGAVFLCSRTDIPPPYHKLFAVQAIITGITLVWICAWEMEVIVSIIGIICHLSGDYVTVTINAFSSVVPDVISYIHLSKNGFGKMAFGGIIGGIVFDMVTNLGAQFAKEADNSHIIGQFGETLYIFLMLTICSMMSWCFMVDFNARRSGGIFLWCLYGLYFFYVTLMEVHLIHDFTDDRDIVEVFL